jgi:hypothetical protein
MRVPFRSLAALAAATALCGLAACSSSSSTGPNTVSLAGNYALTSFSENGQDLSQVATGTLAMTATHYNVNITFLNNLAPAIVDSGTYTATQSGTFSQTSTPTGVQTTGTYTLSNNLLTVNLSTQGITVVQAWQKQ